MAGRAQRDREFTEFASAAEGRLFRQAYALVGEREAAHDLVQTTLTKLYVAWAGVENPSAYARRTMLHTFLSAKRRRTREAELLTRIEPVTAPHEPAVRLTMLDALQQLPPRMRAVVVLRYWEDLSVEATAAALGCTTGTVKSSASRGLAHLRALLGDAFTDRSTPTPEEARS